ncbi:MAG: FecR domain-containing protein [Burkholderiales bacterium]|nr:FecR domain-containing protein [Burkholderiales bacterium]
MGNSLNTLGLSVVASRVIACIFLFATLVAAAETGRIEAAGGNVEVIDGAGHTRNGVVGMPLSAGDSVSTAGEQSWAVLRMEDGASFTLRPNTRLRLDKYHYDENDSGNNSSVLNLLKGSLRAITGLIGKQSPQVYALNTPTATIGIRGTDHETVVIDEGQATEHVPAGTYDSVNDGETVIRNDHGEQHITAGKVGFLDHRGGTAPRLLNYKPALFQRYRAFEQRQGILNVLGRLHRPNGAGGFTAHPDLKERLKREFAHPPGWQARAEQGGQVERQAARRALASRQLAGNRDQAARAQGSRAEALKRQQKAEYPEGQAARPERARRGRKHTRPKEETERNMKGEQQ